MKKFAIVSVSALSLIALSALWAVTGSDAQPVPSTLPSAPQPPAVDPVGEASTDWQAYMTSQKHFAEDVQKLIAELQQARTQISDLKAQIAAEKAKEAPQKDAPK